MNKPKSKDTFPNAAEIVQDPMKALAVAAVIANRRISRSKIHAATAEDGTRINEIPETKNIVPLPEREIKPTGERQDPYPSQRRRTLDI